jgi:hypothetical protein
MFDDFDTQIQSDELLPFWDEEDEFASWETNDSDFEGCVSFEEMVEMFRRFEF